MTTAINILDEMIRETHIYYTKNPEKSEYGRGWKDCVIPTIQEAKSRIQAIGDGWNKFSEKTPENGTSVIVHCKGNYAISDVDDGTLVMDNEWAYEWTEWKLLLPPTK